MRKISEIIIHCADTYERMDIGAVEIDRWHRDRGFLKIGYHYVVRRNGDVETGRAECEVGAHCQGHNSASIGICWVGGKSDDSRPCDNRTPEQVRELKRLIEELKISYPGANVFGHSDFNKQKACPCFNAQREYHE